MLSSVLFIKTIGFSKPSLSSQNFLGQQDSPFLILLTNL